jgi:hypothetical protein
MPCSRVSESSIRGRRPRSRNTRQSCQCGAPAGRLSSSSYSSDDQGAVECGASVPPARARFPFEAVQNLQMEADAPLSMTARRSFATLTVVMINAVVWRKAPYRRPISSTRRRGASRAWELTVRMSARRAQRRFTRPFQVVLELISPNGRRNDHAGESRVRPPRAPNTVGRRSVIFEAAGHCADQDSGAGSVPQADATTCTMCKRPPGSRPDSGMNDRQVE